MANTAETDIIHDPLGREFITPENITGQVTSAGKSAILGGLVAEGYVDIPSRTSRLLRRWKCISSTCDL